MSNTLVVANFDQTSEEKCMFFSFSGNYFFYCTAELVVLAQQSRKKKKRERKEKQIIYGPMTFPEKLLYPV